MNRLIIILVLALTMLVSGCYRHPKGLTWDDPPSASQTTRDGYYRVRRGDTLHAIAFKYDMDWRDIASWNGIPSPYLIYPDQELRLSAPSGSTSTASRQGSSTVTTRPVSTPSSSTKTVTQGVKTPNASTRTAETAGSTTRSTGSAASTGSQSRPPPVSGSDPTAWLWPTEGRIVSNFKANDPSRNGIEIGGKEGQPVVSTAAGEVVYSGNGLIGYGELIIVKHSDRMLSAYAHNRKRLVSEGDAVSAGMKIAEMGRDERNKAVLHFEIRVNGEPGNPLNYLPQR